MRRLLTLLAFFIAPQMAHAEVLSALGISTGAIVSSISGYRAGQDLNVQNVDIRWLSFRSRVLAAVVEFQAGKSANANLTQIMETRGGIQYYPFQYGTDFEDLHDSSTLRYSSSIKPYLHAKVGWGRYLIDTFGTVKLAEVSANFFSVGLGIGTHYKLFGNVALDINVDTSFALGTSVADFSGLLIRPRFGALLYL